MTRSERAKQFMPFAALKGYEDALKEAEFVPEERILLGEDAQKELDATLRNLVLGDTITVTFYQNLQYTEVIGPVKKLDLMNRFLQIGAIQIPLDDLYHIKA